MTSIEVRTVLLRFLRTIIPQIPTYIAIITGIAPHAVPYLIFVGAVLSACDKLARDKGWY